MCWRRSRRRGAGYRVGGGAEEVTEAERERETSGLEKQNGLLHGRQRRRSERRNKRRRVTRSGSGLQGGKRRRPSGAEVEQTGGGGEAGVGGGAGDAERATGWEAARSR